MSATIRRVSRPRGELTPDQLRTLRRLATKRDQADADYRAGVVTVLGEGASYAEVAKATGLSTNTLQRWKREAAES